MALYLNQRGNSEYSEMASATVDRNMQDDLTKLRLKMLGEKLHQQRNSSRVSSESSDDDHPADQAQVRLHKAMLKRDDLLERLKKDRYDPSIRPRSLPRTPEPVQPPPRRPSLPEMKPVQYQPIQPILPPIQQVAPPGAQQPIYQLVPPAQNQSWHKGDFMEMMMMQNAQMQQMVMNQMVMSSLPNQPARPPQIIRLDGDSGGNQPIIIGGGPGGAGGSGGAGAGAISPRGGVVHHHHYQNSPGAAASPLPPMVSNITHLPPLDFRLRQTIPQPQGPPQPAQVLPRDVEPLKQPKDYYDSYYYQPYQYQQYQQEQYSDPYAQYQQPSYNPYQNYYY